jgi:multicomponent Na+:H+ antiporter subunit C
VTGLLAIAVGVVYGVSFYLMTRGSLWRLLLGLALLSHGAHLLIFTGGGLVRFAPPLVRAGELVPQPGAADPLPQALVLTAIVIAFAVLAFALVLALRAGRAAGRDDIDAYGGDPG